MKLSTLILCTISYCWYTLIVSKYAAIGLSTGAECRDAQGHRTPKAAIKKSGKNLTNQFFLTTNTTVISIIARCSFDRQRKRERGSKKEQMRAFWFSTIELLTRIQTLAYIQAMSLFDLSRNNNIDNPQRDYQEYKAIQKLYKKHWGYKEICRKHL